jgi:hypothetical protein
LPSSGDGWAGSKDATGTFATRSLQQSSTYTLACSGSGGTSTQSVTVSVSKGAPK